MTYHRSEDTRGDRLTETTNTETTNTDAHGETVTTDQTDLYAPAYTGEGQLPTSLFNEIVPGLFQGGTPDGDWDVDEGEAPAPRDGELEDRFDAVVTLFAWALPADWGVEELRFGFADSHLDGDDVDRIVEAARWAHRRWSAGRTVLVRCQAGLNRSGLVTALVLMLDGWSAADAVAAIRGGRAPVALFNDSFVDWLVDSAPALIGSATLGGDAAVVPEPGPQGYMCRMPRPPQARRPAADSESHPVEEPFSLPAPDAEGPRAEDKPLLLLDIDGVLNAFPVRDRDDYRRHTIDGFTVHLHRDAAAMVAELGRHYDIVWFTLWNSHAAAGVGPHVGLQDADFLPTSWELGEAVLLRQGVDEELIRHFMSAKTPLLPELLDTHQRWVWIDDAHSDWDRDYLQQQGFDPSGFRLIRTDEHVGLTWDDVAEAVAQAKSWAAAGELGSAA